MQRYVGVLGVLALVAIAVLLSGDRRRISMRLVLVGIGLQAVLGWLLLAFPPVVRVIDVAAAGVNGVIRCADDGTRFIFGELGVTKDPWGWVFAFRALPVIVFFASLMGVLYHWGVMQRVIAALAWILRRSLRVTGAEAMAMAANVFVGQTEAPLCVKPFIARMTRSQLMALMTGGFATIAGSVLAAYVALLGGDDTEMRIQFAKHLLVASVMSAPAAFVIAKIMCPETETPPVETLTGGRIKSQTRNVFDAAAVGATDGLRLALNVGAMLVAFVSLLALINWPIGSLGDWGAIRDWREANGIGPFSLQLFLGWLFTPLSWT
ncbi:MAG: nucleoside transporter C-terminal domain-containing protein, partial [Phycisphaerae bacterium]